jgi:hypothetical protein
LKALKALAACEDSRDVEFSPQWVPRKKIDKVCLTPKLFFLRKRAFPLAEEQDRTANQNKRDGL